MNQPGGPLPPGVPRLGVEPAQPPPAAPSRLSGGKLVWIVLAIVAACGVPVFGVLAALAIFGVRKYVTNAKMGEAESAVAVLAEGVARCASATDPGTGKHRGLPDTSLAVPASLSEVQSAKYQSQRAEWSDPAFVCAGFSMARPQYFQYRWERRSATSGVALAIADLNGDGSPDASVEQPVTCNAGGSCVVGALAKNGP